eukprot:Tbor_TRINITY_DN2230_c0_g1::TRINITY_DN2230_c0_g1_i1::g.2732::m.2732
MKRTWNVSFAVCHTQSAHQHVNLCFRTLWTIPSIKSGGVPSFLTSTNERRSPSELRKKILGKGRLAAFEKKRAAALNDDNKGRINPEDVFSCLVPQLQDAMNQLYHSRRQWFKNNSLMKNELTEKARTYAEAITISKIKSRSILGDDEKRESYSLSYDVRDALDSHVAVAAATLSSPLVRKCKIEKYRIETDMRLKLIPLAIATFRKALFSNDATMCPQRSVNKSENDDFCVHTDEDVEIIKSGKSLHNTESDAIFSIMEDEDMNQKEEPNECGKQSEGPSEETLKMPEIKDIAFILICSLLCQFTVVEDLAVVVQCLKWHLKGRQHLLVKNTSQDNFDIKEETDGTNHAQTSNDMRTKFSAFDALIPVNIAITILSTFSYYRVMENGIIDQLLEWDLRLQRRSISFGDTIRLLAALGRYEYQKHPLMRKFAYHAKECMKSQASTIYSARSAKSISTVEIMNALASISRSPIRDPTLIHGLCDLLIVKVDLQKTLFQNTCRVPSISVSKDAIHRALEANEVPFSVAQQSDWAENLLFSHDTGDGVGSKATYSTPVFSLIHGKDLYQVLELLRLMEMSYPPLKDCFLQYISVMENGVMMCDPNGEEEESKQSTYNLTTTDFVNLKMAKKIIS